MNVASIIMEVALLLIIAWSVIGISRRQGEETPEKVAAWQRAMDQEASSVGRILLSVSRPISRTDLLFDRLPTRQYRFLQSRVLASQSFGSDVEVFLSLQVAMTLVGLGVFALGFFTHGLFQIMMGLGGVLCMLYPWNVVSKNASARAEAVSTALPEFAELLQMSIAGGMGLELALRFTSDRIDGPVSEEVVNMLTLVRTNPGQEQQAYLLAGERLGTPEAKTFFATLLQAQLDGARVLDSLAAQSQALRLADYQRQRATVKKLPVKLVAMFGLHILPLLFVAALLPAMLSLSKV